MTPPNTQPTLPAEGVPTDLEQVFITEQPPRLFPTNQNSNFGLLRKLVTRELQDAADLLGELFTEEFIPTSLGYLGLWEDQMGIPKAPAGASTARRRTNLLSRRTRAPFTVARVNAIIERFITDTFGAGSDFGSDGLSLVSPGIPLFSGTTSLIGSYRVYYNPLTYSYTVWIKNTITPDIAGLNRELGWITPGGISFTIDNTNADVLRYASLVQNSQPVHYWRMGSLGDSGTNPVALTANGGVVVGSFAAPGLLVNPAAGNEAATTFDGVDDYFSATPNSSVISPPQFTLEGWAKVTAFATPTNYRMIVSQNSRYLAFHTGAGGELYVVFSIAVDGVQQYCYAVPSSPPVVNTTYHVVGAFDGKSLKVYLNGVLIGTTTLSGVGAINIDSTAISVGAYAGTHFMNGVIDEVAVNTRALSAAEILDHYNTGRDVATY